MRYAIVSAGVVRNVAEWDGQTQWAPPNGLEAVPGSDAQVGDSYDAKSGFTRPAPPDAPAPPRLVRKSTIVDRLQAVGKLAAASAALNNDLYTRERWYAPDQPSVHADNPEVLALLKAIGADASVILYAE